jgi:hypothetical protein
MRSDKYKCIHIHIPKCAGTSINYALGFKKKPTSKDGYGMWKHANARLFKEKYTSEEQWNNYFKFAIVRNPFDRIVSSYNFLCRDIKPCNFRDRLMFKDFIFRKGEFKDLIAPSLIIKKENKYQQIKTTASYIMDENNNLMIDYVGRFENLKNEWEFICKKIGIKIDLPHKNKHSRNNKHYRDYYDDETREFVLKACEKDLEIFGYEF